MNSIKIIGAIVSGILLCSVSLPAFACSSHDDVSQKMDAMYQSPAYESFLGEDGGNALKDPQHMMQVTDEINAAVAAQATGQYALACQKINLALELMSRKNIPGVNKTQPSPLAASTPPGGNDCSYEWTSHTAESIMLSPQYQEYTMSWNMAGNEEQAMYYLRQIQNADAMGKSGNLQGACAELRKIKLELSIQ